MCARLRNMQRIHHERDILEDTANLPALGVEGSLGMTSSPREDVVQSMRW